MNAILKPTLIRNDRRAGWLIISFSVFVFLVVASLHPLSKTLSLDKVNVGFDKHLLATANAIINTIVSVLLLVALWLVRQKKYTAHRNTMYVAMALSVLFLVSYIGHHLLSGDTTYGGTGLIRTVYFVLLSTHIVLAAIILPFILFTAYRGMTGDYERHKRLSRWTWPLWLYVSITGPVVYLMIAPYY